MMLRGDIGMAEHVEPGTADAALAGSALELLHAWRMLQRMEPWWSAVQDTRRDILSHLCPGQDIEKMLQDSIEADDEKYERIIRGTLYTARKPAIVPLEMNSRIQDGSRRT